MIIQRVWNVAWWTFKALWKFTWFFIKLILMLIFVLLLREMVR